MPLQKCKYGIFICSAPRSTLKSYSPFLVMEIRIFLRGDFNAQFTFFFTIFGVATKATFNTVTTRFFYDEFYTRILPWERRRKIFFSLFFPGISRLSRSWLAGCCCWAIFFLFLLSFFFLRATITTPLLLFLPSSFVVESVFLTNSWRERGERARKREWEGDRKSFYSSSCRRQKCLRGWS